MRKPTMLAASVALPLAVAGAVYGVAAAKGKDMKTSQTVSGYICPLTGQQLPCPKCCPLNKGK